MTPITVYITARDRPEADRIGRGLPCIVFWPISGGNPEYLEWIAKETGNA